MENTDKATAAVSKTEVAAYLADLHRKTPYTSPGSRRTATSSINGINGSGWDDVPVPSNCLKMHDVNSNQNIIQSIQSSKSSDFVSFVVDMLEILGFLGNKPDF